MNHLLSPDNNKGFALIVALGIVFIIVTLAAVAVANMRTDSRASYALRSRLQVRNAASQTAALSVGAVNKDPYLFIEAMHKKGLEAALAEDDIVAGHKARYYNFPLSYFPPFTGLKATGTDPALIDLSRSFREFASASRPVTIDKAMGFSDAFCIVRIRIDALARLGQATPPLSMGYQQYDIDHQNFAEKSDVLYLNVGPVPCK